MAKKSSNLREYKFTLQKQNQVFTNEISKLSIEIDKINSLASELKTEDAVMGAKGDKNETYRTTQLCWLPKNEKHRIRDLVELPKLDDVT